MTDTECFTERKWWSIAEFYVNHLPMILSPLYKRIIALVDSEKKKES
jgi:hypothetical protein